MNEAETRAEHIDPALKAAGWGIVEGSRCRAPCQEHRAPRLTCDICVHCGDGSCLAIRVSTLQACSVGTATCGKTGKEQNDR